MTTKRRTSRAQRAPKKLKLKKETIKDLSPGGKRIKGGMRAVSRSCDLFCTITCAGGICQCSG